jgi:hypothetical protein
MPRSTHAPTQRIHTARSSFWSGTDGDRFLPAVPLRSRLSRCGVPREGGGPNIDGLSDVELMGRHCRGSNGATASVS